MTPSLLSHYVKVCLSRRNFSHNKAFPPTFHPVDNHPASAKHAYEMAPTEIDTLLASWKDLSELVPIEHSTVPRSIPSTKASKAQVKAHFQSPGRSAHPISCPSLPALGIPQQIMLINHTRNNVPALQYYIANDQKYLAHRMLFMRDFVSSPRYTTAETYLWAEQGEPVVEVNGRPLKIVEQWELDLGRIGDMDMLSLQPTPMTLRKGVRNLQVQTT